MKRFVCDSTGLKMNGVLLEIKVATKTGNKFQNYWNSEVN
jgi:hypothetical protein